MSFAERGRVVPTPKVDAAIYYYRPQGKVMFLQACISHSVHIRPRGYSLQCGRHASYWNAFLFYQMCPENCIKMK